MSYASLDEAFSQIVAVQSPRDTKLRPRKHKKSSSLLMPTGQRTPDAQVIEPDRPAHRPLPPAELLGGGVTEFTENKSKSTLLVAGPDPTEDYFPYPIGAEGGDDDEGSWMLKPDWAAEFASAANPKSELPIAPATPIDGYNTLWEQIPDMRVALRKVPEATRGIGGIDDDLREKIDRIFAKLDNTEEPKTKANDESELLLFILIGFFIILILEIIIRQSGYMFAAVGISAAQASMRQGGGGRRMNDTASLLRQLRAAGMF